MSPVIPPLPLRRRKARRYPNPLGSAIFLISVFVLAAFWSGTGNGTWSVSFDGESVALVQEVEEVEAVLARIGAEYGQLSQAERARVKLVRVSRPGDAEYVSARELERRLVGAYGFLGDAVALSIDGQVKMYFKDRGEATAFLDKLKTSYMIESNCEAAIVETLELVQMTAPRAEVIDREGAWRLYKSRTKDDLEHEIKNGDTLWDIAVKYGLSVEQLLKANPGVKPDSVLALGSKLVISKQEPLLTVVTTAEITETRTIPFQVKVERDRKLPMGQRKVVEPGQPGREEVTFKVIRQNGRLVERERIAAVQVEPPKTQVEVRGAMLMVASRQGSGQLAWPVRGSISSGFGVRYGRMHTGIDITSSSGTPIAAAESGRVISAGWGGAYGRMVDIDHGGGVVTRYAHMSRIAVSVGQEVNRGELIGYVGSTGNSSGPHLHFEVIVNGSQLNPINYL